MGITKTSAITRVAAGQRTTSDGLAICTGAHRPLNSDTVVDCDQVATNEQDYLSVADPAVRTYRCDTHRIDGHHPDHLFTRSQTEGFNLTAASSKTSTTPLQLGEELRVIYPTRANGWAGKNPATVLAGGSDHKVLGASGCTFERVKA